MGSSESRPCRDRHFADVLCICTRRAVGGKSQKRDCFAANVCNSCELHFVPRTPQQNCFLPARSCGI